MKIPLPYIILHPIIYTIRKEKEDSAYNPPMNTSYQTGFMSMSKTPTQSMSTRVDAPRLGEKHRVILAEYDLKRVRIQ